MAISHISFDVWNTLIIANPAFAAARTGYLAWALKRDTAEVKDAYTRVKKQVDTAAEDTGVGYTTPEVYAKLFEALNVEYNDIFAEALMYDVNDLFLRHPPTIVDSVKRLIALARSRGLTVSIGSNSNFISGRQMYPWLLSQFDHAFSYGVFSDLERTAKPSATFFGRVIDNARQCRGQGAVPPHAIVHVGDNPICDGWGADEVGIRGLLVKGPDQLFDTVYPYLLSADNRV